MSNGRSSGTATGQTGAGASPPPAAGAPGISADELQRLVDRAAYFNVFSQSGSRSSEAAIRDGGGGGGIIGFRIDEELKRFVVTVQPPTAEGGFKAENKVGESIGRFGHRWVLCPDDYVALPGREPPPTTLDPTRSQRFIMLDGVCTFGNGKDGFRGFGAGKTFPVTFGGRTELLAATVGTILEGFGSFKKHTDGTYLHCGRLTPDGGFTGNMALRVMDTQGSLRTTSGLSSLKTEPFPEHDTTYIVFRGQAVESDPVTPRIGPDGQLRGLTVVQGLRLISLASGSGIRGPRSAARIGQVIGKITAHVDFNPTAPGGTALNPIPFTTFDEFEFTDPQGRDIGMLTADTSEGRVFNIAVGGQGGIRFGGVGRILNGTGPFQGMEGLMTDNSVVIFNPHVSASLYVLRVYDPDGRFRDALNGGR